MSEDAEIPPPETVAELSAACVRFVERALGIALDYTPDTLPILDHYLRETAKSDKLEVLSLVAPAAGAYFGEVVRLNLGGARWHLEEAYEDWRLEFENVFLTFNPVGCALEAVTASEAEGYNAHVVVLPEDSAAVKESLELVGDVRPEDFYRLAVRFEVLEQVSSLLSELAVQKPEGPRSFGPAAYSAFRDNVKPRTLH